MRRGRSKVEYIPGRYEAPKDVLYTSRTGEEMSKATQKAPIYLYSDLCSRVKRDGIHKVLNQMFAKSHDNLILLQDPNEPNSGHWISVSIFPARKEIYFFSSYGGKPDQEKNRWMSASQRLSSGQDTNVFLDGLRDMQLRGWTIHYNDHQYQQEGDETATCGIWTAAFLRSKLNPEQFYKKHLDEHKTVNQYFREYF